jgi:hypothetical protein
MILVKASEESEAGEMPPPEVFEKMGAYNEELMKAGVLLAGEGLHPSSKGVRVGFDREGKQTTVTDGPFAETKELIAGFWIVDVTSLDEAVEWARRAPMWDTELEVRPVFETEDFGDALPEHVREQEERLRAQTAAQRQQS